MLAAVLLATACSSDSSVSFDPNVPSGDDDDDMAASGSSNGTSGKGNASSGSGNSTAGTDGDPTAGSNATAGMDGGGASNGGTPASGGKDPGTAGSASNGGVAGQSGGMGSSAGMPNGASAGMAGMGGTTAGMGGSSGASGTAGTGGSSGGGACTMSAFGGHNYAFCGTVESATAAYQKCQSLGMQPASVESKMENDFLVSKMKATSWLGGSDELQEGEWRWASSNLVFWDGKKVDGMYANWLDGQPNNMDNSGAPENCLVITTSGWKDIACDKADMRALCESTGPVIGPGPGPGFP